MKTVALTCPKKISKPIPKCCPDGEILVGNQDGETESCEIDSTNYHMSISINGHIYSEEKLKKEGKFKHEAQKVNKSILYIFLLGPKICFTLLAIRHIGHCIQMF